MAAFKRNFDDLPYWRRAIFLALMPFLLPALLLIVVLLFILTLWHQSVYSAAWLRWKLLGLPIPPMYPVALAANEEASMQSQEGGGSEPPP
jgi:hypothetical protein